MQRRLWLSAIPAWLTLGAPGLRLTHAQGLLQEAPAQPSASPLMAASQALQFPQDFGAHPEYRTEWWYITGTLRSGERPWGFQITFFRRRIDGAPSSPSAFAARQLIMAHAALTDVQGGHLWHEQRLARTGFGLAQASPGDTQVNLRDWQLQRLGPMDQSRYLARVHTEQFALDLTLNQTQPLMLQGQAGYSRKGPMPEQASRYYSQPQLQLKGQLRWKDQPLAVTGQAWMDHEWSEQMLAPDAVGWDWIGMNLQDGGTLMAFRLRRRDGSTLWAGGSHRPKGQPSRPFEPHEVSFQPGRRWQSPATGASYPMQWQITTPVGQFTVKSRLDAQELSAPQGIGNVYWEGLSDLLDAQGHQVGQGYLEMTGYAAPLVL